MDRFRESDAALLASEFHGGLRKHASWQLPVKVSGSNVRNPAVSSLHHLFLQWKAGRKRPEIREMVFLYFLSGTSAGAGNIADYIAVIGKIGNLV